MARRSKISQLPEEILAEVHAAISRLCTLDEIVAVLANLGVKAPRTNVGRYSEKYLETVRVQREVQATIAALANDIGPMDDKMVAVMLQLVGHELTQAAVARAGGESKPLNPFEIKQITGAMKDIASTQKANDERVRVARRDAFAEASAVAAKASRAGGVSEAMIDVIIKQIAGIDD